MQDGKDDFGLIHVLGLPSFDHRPGIAKCQACKVLGPEGIDWSCMARRVESMKSIVPRGEFGGCAVVHGAVTK